MRSCKIYVDSMLLFRDVRIADNFFTRFKGLMGKKTFDNISGLLITKCKQIHTFFMKMEIDALFMNKNGKVVGMLENASRGKTFSAVRHAVMVLELPSGTIQKFRIKQGDLLEIRNAADNPSKIET